MQSKTENHRYTWKILMICAVKYFQALCTKNKDLWNKKLLTVFFDGEEFLFAMGVPERGADCIMSSRSTAAWLTAGYSPREGSGVHPTYDTAQMSRLSYSPREGSELHRPDNAGQLDQGVIVPKRGADCIIWNLATIFS